MITSNPISTVTLSTHEFGPFYLERPSQHPSTCFVGIHHAIWNLTWGTSRVCTMKYEIRAENITITNIYIYIFMEIHLRSRMQYFRRILQWRQNKLDGVSNHRLPDCLLSRSFSHRSKETAKLHITAFLRGIHRWPVNSPQRASNAENVSFGDVIMDMQNIFYLLCFFVV